MYTMDMVIDQEKVMKICSLLMDRYCKRNKEKSSATACRMAKTKKDPETIRVEKEQKQEC